MWDLIWTLKWHSSNQWEVTFCLYSRTHLANVKQLSSDNYVHWKLDVIILTCGPWHEMFSFKQFSTTMCWQSWSFLLSFWNEDCAICQHVQIWVQFRVQSLTNTRHSLSTTALNQVVCEMSYCELRPGWCSSTKTCL